MSTDTYSTAGSYTWTCPTGVTSVQVECWGGGGSGGRTWGAACGGGGGGAYSKLNSYSVTAGSGYTVVVGIGGTVSILTRTNGGDSYFVNTSTCMAKGGTSAMYTDGTTGRPGGTASSSVGDTKYSGGTGGNAVSAVGSYGGGGGGSGGTSSNGNTGSNRYGATAVTGGGAGGDADIGSTYGSEESPTPLPTNPGGGGGGAGYVADSGYNNGSAGAAGKVVLTYSAISTPTVTTTTASSISTNTASSGGNCTNEGGATVTAKGIVWNRTGSPTVASYLGKTNDGSSSGAFYSTLTPLQNSTKYYYRAYATNSSYTGYGTQYDFTTLPIQVPLISIPSVSSIGLITPIVLGYKSYIAQPTDAISQDSNAFIPAPLVSIGLAKPDFELSIPDIEHIRVDWI